MTPFARPDRSEAADYYLTYIDQVPEGDIREVLEAQSTGVLPLFEGISEEQSKFRYAPDKWSLTTSCVAYASFWHMSHR